MPSQFLYKSIDGKWLCSPVGKCHSKLHTGYLSEKNLKEHGCLKKKCSGFQKIDCKFWDQREMNRINAELKKRELNEWYEKVVHNSPNMPPRSS